MALGLSLEHSLKENEKIIMIRIIITNYLITLPHNYSMTFGCHCLLKGKIVPQMKPVFTPKLI